MDTPSESVRRTSCLVWGSKVKISTNSDVKRVKTIFDIGNGSSVGGGVSGVEITTVGTIDIDWGKNVGVGAGFVGGVVGAGVVAVQAVNISMIAQL